MSSFRPLVLLLQLPTPPLGRSGVEGNVPLAAAYLKLFARRRGLEDAFRIELLPPELVDRLGEQGLVEEILAREPFLVGFTCYLWNIERTLWLAARLKQQRPDLKIAVGGPEITADNAWVLEQPALDYAALGEGEQTFAELLAMLRDGRAPTEPIDGLWVLSGQGPPRSRTPLECLDDVSSPYVEGILDAGHDRTMFLETARGCTFKCRFCYYPKNYQSLYQLSPEGITACLRHAAQRQVKEVVLLDPTLNQRRDFADLLRLFARCNPDRAFTFMGELRAEGVKPEIAQLLHEANFAEVEVGLQSVGRKAQELMGRPVNLKALERGIRAMLDLGIRVQTDLIVGLPGDTVDTVREGIDFLTRLRPACDVQVFNLAVLPGTAFCADAVKLGLHYQSRPPYYVLRTPLLSLEQMVGLMEEAQDALGVEFDPPPLPEACPAGSDCCIDLDRGPTELPPAGRRNQFFVLWLRSNDFARHGQTAAALIAQVLADNPHTTLDVMLDVAEHPERLTAEVLESIEAECYRTSSYLDRCYSMHPTSRGAKRLVVV
jgi:radical SAM superfamily enzyme YgiQ (UPF0313 family)